MSSYVLVHGAWHGGWCWQRATPLLEREGHTVHTPTLTGLAERAAELTPAVGLEDHVRECWTPSSGWTNRCRWSDTAARAWWCASPLAGAMDPEQAALAAELLRAGRLIPIHYDGYDTRDLYDPVHDPLCRLAAATDRATPMTPGETIDV